MRNYLRNGQYTALLTDGALLQVSYTFDRDDVIGHRLCYYPCPLVLKPEISDFINGFDDQLADELDAQRSALNESTDVESGFDLRLRGPLRFDFDVQSAGPNHSASHLHLLHDESRWPICGPLSIGHFVRFVFRHFYSSSDIAALRNWPLQHGDRTVTADEELELFIECRQQVASS
jgi:hypothetical protein